MSDTIEIDASGEIAPDLNQEDIEARERAKDDARVPSDRLPDEPKEETDA